MWTAAAIYHALHAVQFPVDIRNVCVLLAPFMAACTSVVTYMLGKECWNGSAGLFAAAFVSIAPGYVSRSVAGSYDNEVRHLQAACHVYLLTHLVSPGCCNLCSRQHLLLVDSCCSNWIDAVVCRCCAWLLLHGRCMGRVSFSDLPLRSSFLTPFFSAWFPVMCSSST